MQICIADARIGCDKNQFVSPESDQKPFLERLNSRSQESEN